MPSRNESGRLYYIEQVTYGSFSSGGQGSRFFLTDWGR